MADDAPRRGWSTGRSPSGSPSPWADRATPGPAARTSCAPSPGAPAQLVRRYTGLRRATRIPDAELIDRGEWARVNLESFRGMSADVEASIAARMEESDRGPGRRSGPPGARARAAATGAEIGLAVGYLAQRVIGQYDVALIGPAREPRLLFVGPNLSAARARLGVDRELFLSWIALHETTHAVQFAAVPWLRDHLGGIASELFAAGRGRGQARRGALAS